MERFFRNMSTKDCPEFGYDNCKVMLWKDFPEICQQNIVLNFCYDNQILFCKVMLSKDFPEICQQRLS